MSDKDSKYSQPAAFCDSKNIFNLCIIATAGTVMAFTISNKTVRGNDRGQIEGILNMGVGGYPERLEKEYNIIKRNRPFGAIGILAAGTR